MPRRNKSNDPYVKLSHILNTIPNGFKILDDETHLKVLKWIYEPWEAEIASKLKLGGEYLRRIARRIKMPIKDLSSKLDIMEKKGQIQVLKRKHGKKYGLYPFVIGVYEDQLSRMNEEFALLFEEYFQKSKGDILFTYDPPIQRIIPVNRVIKTDLKIHTYNQAETLLENANSWGIRDCICRKQQELIGKGCDYPLSVCISFSSRKNAYENHHTTKAITKEKAFELLWETEEAGLVHTTMNIQKGQTYICNCCTCCCGILKGLVTYNQPHAFVISDYVMTVEKETCNGCGKCLAKCQFKALTIENKKCQVNERCVGCGVCALTCNKKSLSLVPRNRKEIEKPPRNILMWMLKRAFKRRKNPLRVLI